jgi:SNF2 family DNA or RNA helicase
MPIISKIQIEGYCKKVKNKNIYSYPETPASIYRLARTGDDQWTAYPELQKQWDDQMKAVEIAKNCNTVLPQGVGKDVWKHQALAINWGLAIRRGLLWAHMGTGKTRIVLELINIDNTLKKVLIVCPLVVIDTWVQQIKKWLPAYTRGELFPSLREPGDGIVMQNYESLWRGTFGKWAAKQNWDLVVIDECQNIKNAGTKISKYCAKLTAKKKIAMSGTPITNGPLDAFGIYKFLDSGIFGQSYKRFERKYAVVVDHDKYTTVAGYRNQDDFRQCFNFLCLQIESDVLDLPPISHSTISVEMPTEVRRFYDKFEKEFVAYLDDEAMSVPNILTKLLRLQGLTSGVVKLDSEEVKILHESKAKALQTLLEGLDEPVIVFGRFRHDLDECARICRVLNRTYHEISGRRKELALWTDVLGVQIQTGRTGIDLTKSSIAIFLSTGYSSGDYEQAICRSYRPPQKKPVRIINIHCKQTIDKKIAQILHEKKNVVDSLRTCKKTDFMV